MDVCNYCNSSRFFTQEKPPHVGVYCQDCSRWIRWIPKGGTAAPQRKTPLTGQCACWDEIKKINRELADDKDTDNWSGVKILLVPAKTNYQGNRVPCIRIEAPPKTDKPSREPTSDGRQHCSH